MHSRSACQYIWPIRWSPGALDNELKIFRSLTGFTINESLEEEIRERPEICKEALSNLARSSPD